MNDQFANQVVIVTGATSGIGKAAALAFAKQGAALVLTGRRAELGQQVQAECATVGARCVFVEADHTRLEDCERTINTTIEEFGRIDVLFNNAGIVSRGTALTTAEDLWQSTLDINVTSVWRMCRLAIPHMQRQGSGAIVNNASDWAIVGGQNALPYVMSKGAVAMMTKAMALDHAAAGIRVNAVCPGDTFVDRWLHKFEDSDADRRAAAISQASAHIPMKRFAEPQEIAAAVLFLASRESSYITGHLLLVDGGNTAQ
ncbi:SDR family NAD(P)-dependent oxidoreductase [Steroidobacter sp.]|uniref:SDR family NAD(P)-dependent oxidoreductase n=1 Tax=Steroidobacter sp. TaxID=1978227 RepID=UPI001A60EBC9|nr:glucose 1-dehydrogenase [Steroidobacter sp.]MBL8269204.1 glucose 1-dehydrogenase [Steroidobacter sp.]